jgi:hypothetical protein
MSASVSRYFPALGQVRSCTNSDEGRHQFRPIPATIRSATARRLVDFIGGDVAVLQRQQAAGWVPQTRRCPHAVFDPFDYHRPGDACDRDDTRRRSPLCQSSTPVCRPSVLRPGHSRSHIVAVGHGHRSSNVSGKRNCHPVGRRKSIGYATGTCAYLVRDNVVDCATTKGRFRLRSGGE